MTDDRYAADSPAGDGELARLLGEAFEARAGAAVPLSVPPPAPRFLDQRPHRRLGRVGTAVAPLAAAAAVIAAVSVGTVVAHSGDATGRTGSVAAARHSSVAAGPARPSTDQVQVSLLNSDHQTYGVGMPIIAYFSRAVTDARAFQAATTVTANGRPLTAAWYFEASKAGHGPLEAHLRPQLYWPAHASIHVSIRAAGLSAGNGLDYADDLSLNFTTGPQTILQIDSSTDILTVNQDGTNVYHCPVALGAPDTPTMSGIKVIMAKAPTMQLTGPGFSLKVNYAQRLTYSGEFLLTLQAPTSTGTALPGTVTEGGTELSAACAKQVYEDTMIGDIVNYPNADGPQMQLGLGYGDWNLSWGQWLTGGAVPTR